MVGFSVVMVLQEGLATFGPLRGKVMTEGYVDILRTFGLPKIKYQLRNGNCESDTSISVKYKIDEVPLYVWILLLRNAC